MAEYDRGTYDPQDQIRVFDGSEDDDDTEGSRLPVLIVIALVVLASFAGVVWLAYEKGVSSGRNEPRTIMADSGASKNESGNGGTQSTYKGLKVYDQPAPSDTDVATSAPLNSVLTPPPNTTSEQQGVPSLRAPVTDAAPERTAVVPPPTAPVKPEKKIAALPSATAAPLQAAPVAAPPPSTPVAAPTDSTTAPMPEKAAVKGGYLLQIGSYKSEEEANAAWTAAKAKYAAILSGFSPDVKQVSLPDKGTWFRLRVASFEDKSAATALCDKLKADGGTCLLAK